MKIRMRIKKKFILVGICLIIVMTTGGCEKMYNDYVKKKQEELPSREEVKQEMLNHLQEKYGEEFECVTIEYKSWSQSGMEQMEAYPKGSNPNYNFALDRKTNEDGSITYEDGYVGFLMEEKYVELLEPVVKEYFPESTVWVGYNKYTYPEAFTKETTFEEFQEYAGKKIRIGIGVYIPMKLESEEEVAKKIEAMGSKLKELLPIGRITVTGYSEEAYQTDIVEDIYQVRNSNSAYPTKNEIYNYKQSWGEIDFDYEYREEK